MERGRQVRAEVSVPDSSALHKMTVEFAMKRSIVPYLGMHLRWPSCQGVPLGGTTVFEKNGGYP
jgi:hypothetical protein